MTFAELSCAKINMFNIGTPSKKSVPSWFSKIEN